MSTTYIAHAERAAPVTGDEWKRGSSIIARVQLVHLDGNQRPYFSATAEISTRAERNRGDFQAGGCLHEEIVHYFPDLAPVVLVHLADDDGTPMHAEANGAYHLGLTKWEPYNREHVASHFRISAHDADSLHALVTGADDPRAELAHYIEGCRPRWKQEAADALAAINRTAEKGPQA